MVCTQTNIGYLPIFHCIYFMPILASTYEVDYSYKTITCPIDYFHKLTTNMLISNGSN